MRARRAAATLVPLACAVTAAVPYLFLIGYAAPRFLLPAYALLVAPGRGRPRPSGHHAARTLACRWPSAWWRSGWPGHLAVQYAVLAAHRPPQHAARRATGPHASRTCTVSGYGRPACSPGTTPSRSPSTPGARPRHRRQQRQHHRRPPSPGPRAGSRSPSSPTGTAPPRPSPATGTGTGCGAGTRTSPPPPRRRGRARDRACHLSVAFGRRVPWRRRRHSSLPCAPPVSPRATGPSLMPVPTGWPSPTGGGCCWRRAGRPDLGVLGSRRSRVRSANHCRRGVW